jgi:hypothetical protein
MGGDLKAAIRKPAEERGQGPGVSGRVPVLDEGSGYRGTMPEEDEKKSERFT